MVAKGMMYCIADSDLKLQFKVKLTVPYCDILWNEIIRDSQKTSVKQIKFLCWPISFCTSQLHCSRWNNLMRNTQHYKKMHKRQLSDFIRNWMMSLQPLLPHTLLTGSMQVLLFRFVVFSRKISIHSSAKGESRCKFCLCSEVCYAVTS